ncbi:metallophosphoesterase [Aegicerativicinus sediminis]|uniref:metallophosphoesterase n=1 Tax=Aegicerativicinus sediminis TaxID=2893202 RepID=UPI001E5C9FFF|nr:metallophosphoesterase [Aegicerativicinus sediminis]
MKISLKVVFALSLIFLISACATYKPQYASEDFKEIEFPEKKEINRTFYLIGDAGVSPMDGMSEGLMAFKKYIEGRGTKDDYAIFLGDNIYPEGMPKDKSSARPYAENNLNAQVKAVTDFKGSTLFIPGNHDWYSKGPVGLKDEEKFIEDALGDNTFQPENGCPLESIDISDTVQLLVVDSQWFLTNWDYHPTINDDCEIKTRERFFIELEGEIKKAQGKTVVLAMHHPMFTYGAHGGHYSLRKHLFPLQSDIPMPGLASLLTQIRTQGGISIQDRYNESYNNLMKRIETLVIESGKIVIVSGHEHNIQYIESEDDVKQIVSGAGSKESFAALGKEGLFSYGRQGFAELTVFKDGSSWVRIYSAENGEPKLLFQHEVYPPDEQFDLSQLPDEFPEEVETSIYTKPETDVSSFYETVLGDRYRDVYGANIKVKVATLDTLYGGLEVVRAGGGHQTRSLRLKRKDGRELNMRALRKSATQYLQTVLFKDTYIQDDFEQTEIEDLILDFYTAAHPYAFLAMPDLSDAAAVYHTNPKLYYIPKHKALGKYNKDYGGEIYMIVERPEENYTSERTFGYADDIESTHDIIEKIREDEKYKIDEEVYIRSRLFDMLVGDWDRHQDQWRWAQFDMNNGDKIYRPIPRDRDQVFSNFDGALLDLMRVISGSAKTLQVYDAELKDIEWMNAAGVKLDRVLVQQSELRAWLNQARYLQDHISDEVIENAFNKIPEEVRGKTIDDIKEKLKGRRENMIDIATRYYNYLNGLVILTGTDKDDYIEITRVGDGQTHVKISRIKDGEKADVIVDRTFDRSVTKEIWIYGLDDDDIFETNGKANNPIFTRIIGGLGNDIYRLNEGRRIKVYDHQSKKNTFEKKGGAQIKTTDVYNLNLFDFQKYISKNSVMTPSIGYNPDDGVKVGFQTTKVINGFQRNPFSHQHKLKGGYFFATKGFALSYDGEFANIMNDWNLQLTGLFTSNNFTFNYFGYGNDTENLDDDLGLDYNRVKTSIIRASGGILRKPAFGSDYGIRAIVEGIKIEQTDDRYITDEFVERDEEFYERKYFGSLEAEFKYHSSDNNLNPTRGMNFLLNIGGTSNFDDFDSTFGYINTDIGFYNALTRNRKLVLKTDARAQFRIGDDYMFYQAANLGGRNGLRGYRTERFTGRSSFVGSADVRYSFRSFQTKILPIQIGIFTGFDVGRVWAKGENSKQWHNDYGGGFWVTAAESISGTFNLFHGAEGLRFSFGFGLNF